MHLCWAVVKRLIYAGAAALLALQSIACGSTSVTQSTAPEVIARCQTTLGTVPTIPAAGGKVEVGVAAERECAWTAASNSSWIQISPTSGQGESSITLTANSNPQGTARNGNVSINNNQVAVTQAASPCTFSVSPTSVTIPAAGRAVNVEVTTLIGCGWNTSSPVSWVTLSNASGTGTNDVTLTAGPNGNTSPRSTTVTIAGRSVSVTQDATPAPTPSPSPTPTPTPKPTDPTLPSPQPPPSCTYSLDPAIRIFKAKGGGGTVKVTTAKGCPWTATSGVDWVEVKGDSSGTESHDVHYEVERNRSGFGRSGSITIAGQTHLILQGWDGDD
jgi:hypothetical protein